MNFKKIILDFSYNLILYLIVGLFVFFGRSNLNWIWNVLGISLIPSVIGIFFLIGVRKLWSLNQYNVITKVLSLVILFLLWFFLIFIPTFLVFLLSY